MYNEFTNYKESIKITKQALKEFRDDIDYYLPDSWETGKYAYPWQVSDEEDTPKIVYSIISDAVHKILETDMANHIAAELRNILNEYKTAMEVEDVNNRIIVCQGVLHRVMDEFSMISLVCNTVKDKIV